MLCLRFEFFFSCPPGTGTSTCIFETCLHQKTVTERPSPRDLLLLLLPHRHSHLLLDCPHACGEGIVASRRAEEMRCSGEISFTVAAVHAARQSFLLRLFVLYIIRISGNILLKSFWNDGSHALPAEDGGSLYLRDRSR